jgi:hypothetical protein
MEDEQQLERYKVQAKMLEDQRSWLSEMAQQTSVEEQRKRCYELVEKLTRKIEGLQQRISCLP